MTTATRDRYLVALVLAGAVLAQLLLIAYLGDRAYLDVLRAVNFGAGVETGVISIRTHADNTKTFLGPLLWYRLVEIGGLAAIKAFNLGSFVALFAVQAALGRRLSDRRVTLVALVLTAFYTGTLRNVAAGEPDDMTASLLFAAGVLCWLGGQSAVVAGLVMGTAFLFKFWVLVFFGGFIVFLVGRSQWRSAVAASVAFAVPFLCLSLADRGASLGALVGTAYRQAGYSTWSAVAARLVVTGILPAFLAAGWLALRRPDPRRALAFLVPAPYLLYVVIMRDAHAVSFVMMLCLVLWSFPIAELLLERGRLAGRAWMPRVFLTLYLIAAPANAYLNLWRDTYVFSVLPGCGAKPVWSSAPVVKERCASH